MIESNVQQKMNNNCSSRSGRTCALTIQAGLMKNKVAFHVIANAALGPGLSGGDRIFIECARRWARAGHKVNVYVWEEGYEMCGRNRLAGVQYVLWSVERYKKFGFLFLYLIRLIKGVAEAFRWKTSTKQEIVYSASEFPMDLLPAWIVKLRYPKIRWVASFYLFIPSPFSKLSPYKGLQRIKNLVYFMSQALAVQVIKKYADMVWVTNELDRWRFVDNRKLTPDKVVAVKGGVDTRTPALVPEPKEKTFDAVFIGRFHPQKGVLELIEIWKRVCKKKRDAKLVMIGIGDLESEVKEKIRKYGLENNITLLGFKDGVEKLKIFKESKVVVHPAIYDSGGMAACEAMACGLPGVSFDLSVLRTYYPKGMLKTPCYDLKRFAQNIMKLLNDRELYKKVSEDALAWAKEWDWDKRALELLTCLEKLIEVHDEYKQLQ